MRTKISTLVFLEILSLNKKKKQIAILRRNNFSEGKKQK